MSLQQSLMQALVVLGSSADEVAARLAALGFKGQRAIAADCPGRITFGRRSGGAMCGWAVSFATSEGWSFRCQQASRNSWRGLTRMRSTPCSWTTRWPTPRSAPTCRITAPARWSSMNTDLVRSRAEQIEEWEKRGKLVWGCLGCRPFYITDHQCLTSVFAPRHGASARCESGKRPHCTCDTCF